MAKASNKNKRPGPRAENPVSLSIQRCEDSLKNFCEPGSFAKEIDIRAQTVTPLLKEILDFRPRPHWR